ncbi:hypothetical protein ACHWQZ_G011854 [Mnemiopsis leidyi]
MDYISLPQGQMPEGGIAIGNGTREIQLENSTLPGKEAENYENQYRTRKRIPMPSIHHVLIAFIVLIVVVTTVSLAIVLNREPDGVRTQPNILVVIADDLGYNDVGYQGPGDIKTPYIDHLARSSIVLERHYTQPMCSPSRAAMFTGRYPFRYGMSGSRAIYYGSRYGLDLSEYLLPQALKEAKYKTYLLGKWHLGFADWLMTPTRRGFDYFYGTYGGSTTYRTHQSYEGPRAGDGYDLFEDNSTHNGTTVSYTHQVVDDPAPGTFSELLFTEKAVKIITGAQGDVEPFFLVVSYQNPHAPITPMANDVAQNEDIDNENRRKMAGMITSLDYGVGRITSALETTHQLNETIIIFLSDNGGHLMMPSGESLGSSNLPFRGAKCTLYEGGVRTPAFIKIPQFTPVTMNSSVKYNGLFHISDWFPTILKLAQLEPGLKGKQLDGVDHSETFRKLLGGTARHQVKKPRDHVVLDIDPVFNQAAIVQEKYKLIVGKGAIMSFDQVYPLISDESIENDPEIVKNASHYQVSPSIYQEMMDYTQIQVNYSKNPQKCLSLDCMTDALSLFDLSWDFGESNNLTWRFTAEAKELYKTLKSYSNSTFPMVEPQFFEDHNKDAKTEDNVWTPWLLNSTVVKSRK